MESFCRTSIEEEVLAKIRPSWEERRRAEEAAREAIDAADTALRLAGFKGYELRLEGSFAKDTWLSGELDFDIFALFNRDRCLEAVKDFAARVEPVLRKLGYRVELKYAQHPYLRFLVQGFWAELVPGCRAGRPEDVVTPVDRTPLHTEFIRSRLEPWQRDEVRLLKSFMKGIGVYGAEMAIRGFSGYLAELLVVKYRCFRRVVSQAADWRPPVYIDIDSNVGGHVRDKHGAKEAVMILPDPVDPRRNAAAAVSTKSLAMFILASKLYTETPCSLFFHRFQPPPPRPLPWLWGRRLSNLLLIQVEPGKRVPPENMWGITARLRSIVEKALANHGFRLRYISHTVDEDSLTAYVLVEAEATALPDPMLREGPPSWAPLSRVKGFLVRHRWAARVNDKGLLETHVRGGVKPRDVVEKTLATSTPRSLKETAARVRLLQGLEAAEAVSRLGGRWAWEAAMARSYWLWLVASKCMKQ